MADAATIQTRIDLIDAAIAKGESSIRDGEERIDYRSVADMLKAREALQTQLAEAQGTQRVVKTYRLRTRKGWE